MSRQASKRPSAIGGRIWLARLALLWETAWPALWPPIGVLGLFLTAALFDLLPVLPGWLHGLALLAFAGAFGWTFYRALPALRPPTGGAAQRRIERESALDHRPLALLQDELASGRGDSESEALWEAHRRRMLERIAVLKVGAPRPGLPKRDPWALRGALLLLLVVAGTNAWDDGGARLARAFAPRLAGLGASAPAGLEVWISPPGYTGLPPRFLRFGAAVEEGAPAGIDGVIEVPADSTLMAQLHGGRGTPHLRGGGNDADFQPIAGGGAGRSYQIEGRVARAGRMSVTQGGAEVGAWTVAIGRDGAPAVAFVRPPSPTPRAALRIEYRAEDDYGVIGVKAVIQRKNDTAAGAPAEPIVLEMPISGTAPKKAHATGYNDLTAHIWAGLPVVVQLEAKDAAGQTSASTAVEIVLPERHFNNRLAKLLVEMRKQLVRDPSNATRKDVANMAARRAVRPQDFRHDVVVFLALRSVYERLLSDPRDEAIGEVQDLLWDTALRIEDGEMSLAERALRDAQQALEDALQRDVGDAELQEVLDQLQQALDEFFQAMAEDMRRNPEKYQGALPPDENMEVLEAEDLKRLLDRIREMATTGAKDAARQLLAQLREMLENLRMGLQNQDSEGQQQARGMLKSLEDLIRKQQELMEKTFRDAQKRQNPLGQGQRPRVGEGAADQEALRRALGNVMRQLGEFTGNVPESLGRAERSMKSAREALEKGDPGRALGPQGEALEQMRAGIAESLRQLAQRLGGQFGFGNNRQGPRRGNRDPMGRPYDSRGANWGSDVKVPDERELQRARQILDELHRRAGENFREREELDYIERLLRRF